MDLADIKLFKWGLSWRDEPSDELLDKTLNGDRNIETRLYPVPLLMINEPTLIIKTCPKIKATGVGVIIFTGYKVYYTSEDFYKDSNQHLIYPGDKWDWDYTKGQIRYGWSVGETYKFKTNHKLSKRHGIKFSRNISIC